MERHRHHLPTKTGSTTSRLKLLKQLARQRVSCDEHKDCDSLSRYNALHPCTPGRLERNGIGISAFISLHVRFSRDLTYSIRDGLKSTRELQSSTRMLFGSKEHKTRHAQTRAASRSLTQNHAFALFLQYFPDGKIELTLLARLYLRGVGRTWLGRRHRLHASLQPGLFKWGRTFREETGAFVAQGFAAAGSQAQVRGHR